MAFCQQLDGVSNEVLLQFLVLKSSLIGERFVVCCFKAALRRPKKTSDNRLKNNNSSSRKLWLRNIFHFHTPQASFKASTF